MTNQCETYTLCIGMSFIRIFGDVNALRKFKQEGGEI